MNVVTLEFNEGAAYDRALEAQRQMLGLAKDVASEVVEDWGDTERVHWVAKAPTPTAARCRYQLAPVPPTESGEPLAARIVDALVDGVADVAAGGRPEHFSDLALEHLGNLIEMRGELEGLSIMNGIRGTLLTAQMGENIGRLIAAASTEVGSVEGTLESVNLHVKSRYFNVYDFLTGRRMRCEFGDRIDPREIGRALGRRVAVYGIVHVRASGQVERVAADELHIFPTEAELPPLSDARGILTR